MFSIEELRKRNGWNTSQLGHATGQDRRLLAELERGGTLATPELVELLTSYGVLGLASHSDLIAKRDLRALRLQPYSFPTYNQEAWDRAASYKPELYRKIRPHDLAWLRRYVRTDSALECDLWVILVLAGAKLRLANPHSCGYRNLPIVDDLGMALGERLLPCLHLKRDGLDVIIWPQVSLRPGKWTFRVDGLVLRISPRPHWGGLEADGKGHAHEKDNFRTAQLLHDMVRLSSEEMQHPDLIQILIYKLLQF